MAGKEKPSIVEIASEYLQGDFLENFLDFYGFLEENELTIVEPVRMYYKNYAIKHKGRIIGTFGIWTQNAWFFNVATYKDFCDADTFEKYITPEQKKFLLDNIHTTPYCCRGKENIEFFGKIYSIACTCLPHLQWNPEGEALDFAKGLILANMNLVNDLSANTPEEKPKTKIEEVVSEFLQGVALKNFLDFHGFLKDNNLSVTKPTKILNGSWTIKHKGKKLGGFKILDYNKWFFGITTYNKFTDAETYESYITPEQKKFLLDNIRTTPICCTGKDNIEFFGKIYNTVCTCWPHLQWNPEGEELEYAKQLTLANMNLVADLSAIEDAYLDLIR